jgi:CheY-like chemotaxis protein
MTERSGPPNAFVIDDEDGFCKFVSMTLHTLGVKAESFRSAEIAVAALERGHLDFIFLGLALQESDAIDVIRRLGAKRYRGVVQLMSGSNLLLLDDVRRVGIRHGLKMRPPLRQPMPMDAIRETLTAETVPCQPEITRTHAPLIRKRLDEALASGWLELWYQPKINLRPITIAGSRASSDAATQCTASFPPPAYCPTPTRRA